MAVTLAQAKLNVQDDLDKFVIDEFAKSSFIIGNIPFHNCVSPTGGSTTMTYAYTRLITQPNADFREVNSEYVPSEVTKQRHTVDLKIFGGTFEIDRVIANMGGIASEVELQIQQKAKATSALFNDTVINGDSAINAKSFDGLNKALTGSSTEYNTTTALDLSSSANIDTNYKKFIDMLDEFLLGLDGTPSAIMGNTKLVAVIRAIARRAGQYQETKDSFGNNVSAYGSIPIIDLGAKAGTNDSVVDTNATSGETSLYAVRLGLDGFHAISAAGQLPVKVWLPDFNTSGAVKKGEVEMLAAVALKATKAAGVFRKIKVK